MSGIPPPPGPPAAPKPASKPAINLKVGTVVLKPPPANPPPPTTVAVVLPTEQPSDIASALGPSISIARRVFDDGDNYWISTGNHQLVAAINKRLSLIPDSNPFAYQAPTWDYFLNSANPKNGGLTNAALWSLLHDVIIREFRYQRVFDHHSVNSYGNDCWSFVFVPSTTSNVASN